MSRSHPNGILDIFIVDNSEVDVISKAIIRELLRGRRN